MSSAAVVIGALRVNQTQAMQQICPTEFIEIYYY